ncbi:MAG: hypothetical protein FWF96_07470, partial [Kiritimatiellaeota bacterium]|nr:hypothetical protein [Kiritimatiellota bacterium]
MKMKFALLLAMMVGRAMAEGEEGGAETPDTARRDAVAPLEPGRLFERGMVDINQPITITSERFE